MAVRFGLYGAKPREDAMSARPLVIIGAGPAGLSAAIYAARAGLTTLVLGCDPKIAGDYDIDNYFGFPETISGRELVARGRRQAERFGAEIHCARVLGIHADDAGFLVTAEDDSIAACAVILATGVARVRPKIPGLAGYEGRGISYCVSCDGFFFRNKPVVVLGEGSFAANQALELSTYTPQVRICTQGRPLSMSQEFLDRLHQADIPILESSIVELAGAPALERVVYANGSDQEASGLFIAMGEASSLDFAYALGVERNGVFLVADADGRTNVPGVFAAGDCIGGFLQISVAVGDGAKAARSAIDYVKKTCTRA